MIVTPRARRDVDETIAALGLPDDTWRRVARSLRVLEAFPLAGPELEGRWAPTRFVRSSTQDRATYTMQFERYEEVPASIAEEIIEHWAGEPVGPPPRGVPRV